VLRELEEQRFVMKLRCSIYLCCAVRSMLAVALLASRASLVVTADGDTRWLLRCCGGSLFALKFEAMSSDARGRRCYPLRCATCCGLLRPVTRPSHDPSMNPSTNPLQQVDRSIRPVSCGARRTRFS